MKLGVEDVKDGPGARSPCDEERVVRERVPRLRIRVQRAGLRVQGSGENERAIETERN